MGRRFVPRDTTRHELGDGDWVELRPLSFGDRRAIQAKLLGMDSGDIALTERALDHAAANIEMLRRAVTAWGGPGFCVKPEHSAGHDADACVPAPIDAEHIEALADDDLMYLISEGRSRSDPKAISRSATSQPSPGAEAAPTTTRTTARPRRRS